MEGENSKAKERTGKKMKIEEAKKITPEEFKKLDDAYGGFETENTKNHPLRDEDETFMQFIKKGSEKIKSEPAVKKILGLDRRPEN